MTRMVDILKICLSGEITAWEIESLDLKISTCDRKVIRYYLGSQSAHFIIFPSRAENQHPPAPVG